MCWRRTAMVQCLEATPCMRASQALAAERGAAPTKLYKSRSKAGKDCNALPGRMNACA
eukprot:CAMPEP_0175284378 /NCGR_PEP_ID=MMETSP0093-20121207/52653_1 /TAXON_ID=311494 /ORGANISM="Alexandrium monilatum, Strain CCMP3105" /LENGTH=57 /DNA_ID=CAMNT_0016579683 /DNA_START=41 /DNA_END=211 /DNA_ORIENTATION=-